MLTVRFPNGTVLKYNGAHWLRREEIGWKLSASQKDADNGHFIAVIQASAGAIVETDPPCGILDGTAEAVARIADDPARLRDLSPSTLRKLKTALRDFHMQRGWR